MTKRERTLRATLRYLERERKQVDDAIETVRKMLKEDAIEADAEKDV